MITLVLLSPLVFLNPLQAVDVPPKLEWQKTYGPYGGNALIQTVDGGFAVAGVNASYSFEMYRGYGQYQPLLIKIDSNGEMEWAKTYELSGGASSVVQTQDSGFLLCGGAWILKTDVNGNSEWNTTLKSGGYVAVQTSSEAYLAGGRYYDAQSGDFIPIVYKFDSQGNQLWNKSFTLDTPFVSASWIESVEEATDGNYIIVGTWNGDYWFAKLDTSGNVLVKKIYHYADPYTGSPKSFSSISKTLDDAYILSAGVGLFKINSDGVEIWHQFYDYGDNYGIISAIETNDEGFVASGGQNSQVFVLKTDKYGREEWTATYGQEETIDSGSSVIATNDGFVVTGKVNRSEVWLAKFSLPVVDNPRNPTMSVPTETDPMPTLTIAAIALTVTAFVITTFLVIKRRTSPQ